MGLHLGTGQGQPADGGDHAPPDADAIQEDQVALMGLSWSEVQGQRGGCGVVRLGDGQELERSGREALHAIDPLARHLGPQVVLPTQVIEGAHPEARGSGVQGLPLDPQEPPEQARRGSRQQDRAGEVLRSKAAGGVAGVASLARGRDQVLPSGCSRTCVRVGAHRPRSTMRAGDHRARPTACADLEPDGFARQAPEGRPALRIRSRPRAHPAASRRPEGHHLRVRHGSTAALLDQMDGVGFGGGGVQGQLHARARAGRLEGPAHLHEARHAKGALERGAFGHREPLEAAPSRTVQVIGRERGLV